MLLFEIFKFLHDICIVVPAFRVSGIEFGKFELGFFVFTFALENFHTIIVQSNPVLDGSGGNCFYFFLYNFESFSCRRKFQFHLLNRGKECRLNFFYGFKFFFGMTDPEFLEQRLKIFDVLFLNCTKFRQAVGSATEVIPEFRQTVLLIVTCGNGRISIDQLFDIFIIIAAHCDGEHVMPITNRGDYYGILQGGQLLGGELQVLCGLLKDLLPGTDRQKLIDTQRLYLFVGSRRIEKRHSSLVFVRGHFE